jgi:SnoaL-like domain
MDLVMAKSAYWEDGTDNHGPFVGNGYDLCAFAYNNRNIYRMMIHHVTNTNIETHGSQARVEIYFICVIGLKDPNRDCFLCGRYKDLYEKRGEDWKILRRVAIWDWTQMHESASDWSAMNIALNGVNGGGRYPDDRIYKPWQPFFVSKVSGSK